MYKMQAVDETIRRRIHWLVLGGLAGLGIATILFVMVQAAQARELPLWSALSLPPLDLFSGRIGLFMGVRLLLIAVLGAFVVRLPAPGTGGASKWWIIILLGGAIALTFSLQGHGAAQGSVLAVVVIWLHLAGTAVWLGGLPMLFLALRQEGVVPSMLVPRFSQAALISVATLVATGIYNGITFIGTTEALTDTTYGRSVISKTVFFALLLTLGTINLFYLSPRLRQAIPTGRKGLTYTVPLEMALGIILLLAVGVLSGVFPAFDALQAQREQGLIERANVDGVDILVRVAPGEAGDNEIGVEFSDTRPGAAMVAPEVLLRLTALSMDMGTQQVEATSADGLRYSARGSYFPMTGPWELEVIIRRTGFNDVRRIFQLEIQDK
jgi:copper transport protein